MRLTKWALTLALFVLGVGGVKVNAKTLSVNLSALPAESENTTWSWNSGTSTGIFAWSAGSWNSTELYGSGNYSAYQTLNLVTAAGTADHFRIIVKFTNGTGQLTINPVAVGTTSITLSKYMSLEDLANVSTIRLSGANDATGDITVSSIYLEGPDINYIEDKTIQVTPTGTTDLNGITGTGAPWSIIYPITVADGTLFGSSTIDSDEQSANIDAYDYILFNVTEASADAAINLRVFVSTAESSDNSTRVILYPRPIADYASVADAAWTTATTITAPGVYVAKISAYPLLRGIKNRAYWQGDAGSIKISLAYVGSGSPVAPVDKVVRSGEEALTDPNATCFDVTKLEGTGLTFNASNPNALFIAKAGQLTNTKNVIVSGTCANLVLEDGYNFQAPFDFTATQASYTTTISSVGAGTLCLPFACKIPYEVQAWTLAYTSGGDKATATEVETVIPANTPVLLNGSGEKTFTGADAPITAGAATTAEALTGVYEEGFVPKDCYVLQNGTGGLGFYKVANDNEITIKPFRAYLTASASSAPSVSIVYGSDDTTGINIVEAAGQRVAQPTKGLYIVNGKKVIVK